MLSLCLVLKNVLIHGIPVEEEREMLTCVVFRALRPFGDKRLFRAIWKKMQVGAVLCAYKGKIINAKLELTGLADDPVLSSLAAHAQIIPVWVPFLEEERCVVIAKKSLTIDCGYYQNNAGGYRSALLDLSRSSNARFIAIPP